MTEFKHLKHSILLWPFFITFYLRILLFNTHKTAYKSMNVFASLTWGQNLSGKKYGCVFTDTNITTDHRRI